MLIPVSFRKCGDFLLSTTLSAPDNRGNADCFREESIKRQRSFSYGTFCDLGLFFAWTGTFYWISAEPLSARNACYYIHLDLFRWPCVVYWRAPFVCRAGSRRAGRAPGCVIQEPETQTITHLVDSERVVVAVAAAAALLLASVFGKMSRAFPTVATA